MDSKRINFRIHLFLVGMVLIISSCLRSSSNNSAWPLKFPLNDVTQVNPDTYLELTFPVQPFLGRTGMIRIYNAADVKLVDSLDLSIPPGPTEPNRERVPYISTPYDYTAGHRTNANTKPGTPSGGAWPTPDTFQLTIIGGFTDGFHFYPVIIDGHTARIYPHHNLLEYGQSYYVQVDSGAINLKDKSFRGISGKNTWRFTTKSTAPPVDSDQLVVSADGSGDFTTVQGAVDFIPEHHPQRITIFIKKGKYEEIVYFRNKSNITFLGEDMDSVLICYANNEVFNPHPANIATNEWPGTFPSRRAVFMADNSSGIHLVNFTIRSVNDKPAQAEGLLLMGDKNIVSHLRIEGSGDALQANGSVYLTETRITGLGDNVLGRGPAFFNNCELISTSGPHMWIRNTAANHGNVFLNCIFKMSGNGATYIARTSDNNGNGYPYSEAVLLSCALQGVHPSGWSIEGLNTSDIHYWEYSSRNLSDGLPADTSQRHPLSRQLTMENDSALIASYSNPAFVLGGWTPAMAPAIITQPLSGEAALGGKFTFRVEAAAIPEANYQWFKDRFPLNGTNEPVLQLSSVMKAHEGGYYVEITNAAGSAKSKIASLKVYN